MNFSLPNSSHLAPLAALIALSTVGHAQFSGVNVVSPPGLVNRGGATDTGAEFTPSLVSNGGDVWMCAFTSTDSTLTNGGDMDVFWTRSRDLGLTWSALEPIAADFLTDGGLTSTDFQPALATDGNTRVIVWATSRPSSFGNLRISAASGSSTSTTWSAPVVLEANSGIDGLDDEDPCLAGANGVFVAVWERRETAADYDLYFARTANGGGTWSTVARLHPSSATDSGSDNNASIVTDGAGHWVVVCETQANPLGTGTDKEIVAWRSLDNGLSWVGPALVNATAASDAGAFDSQPSVAVDVASGTWVCTWRTAHAFGGLTGGDSEIAFARSTNFGQTWQPVGILNADFATDQSSSTGDGEPCLRADQNGHFFASWTRTQLNDSDLDVLAARSDDLGVTWTTPALLDISGATDSGFDAHSQLATDGAGHWLGVWEASDSPGLTLGTDLDIVGARFLQPLSSFQADFCYGYVEAGNPPRCPCSNDSPITGHAGCLNSSGTGAQVGFIGALEVSSSTETMSFGGTPPGAAALVFQGTGIFTFGLGITLGDGRLCVGGQITRLGVGFAGPTGNGGITFAPVGVSAGDTRFYQTWYRDSVAFCTSATFNLSSAFGTVWQP